MNQSRWKRRGQEQTLVEKRYEVCSDYPGESGNVTIPMLEYPMLQKLGIVSHGFSTREGGVSTGVFATFNFSFTRGDDERAVRENYERLARIMGTTTDHIVTSDQTHTTNVMRVTAEHAGAGVTRERAYHDMDGLITDEPGLVLATFYADCVPLYFVDPVHRAIGLSHSGWRGTVQEMGRVTLDAMRREFGTRPEEVYAAIGPSICQDCYEISEDVAEEFRSAFPEWEHEILRAKGNGKYQLDLWKCNEYILLRAGVAAEHLAVTDICTCCNPTLLFSHRASRGRRGNLGAFLMLRT